MEQIDPRPCTALLNMPKNPKDVQQLQSLIVQDYDFVMLMGLSCTGKSTFIENYESPKNWDHTLWSRDPIFDMLFASGRRPNKFYGKINKFEDDVLPEQLERDYHQVIIEGWNRTKNGRNRYLNYIPNYANLSKCIIVFDGPFKNILIRNRAENRLNKEGDQLKIFLKEQHKNTEWPEVGNWDDIFYVNTFGETGLDYLRPSTFEHDKFQ